MKDVVLITGANGSLAQSLAKQLNKDYAVRFLTTKKVLANKESHFYWNLEKEYVDSRALANCKHIIHLAGYPILKKWTKKNKQLIYNSRVKSTSLLFSKCKSLNIKIEALICASAIGIYESSLKEEVTEGAIKGDNWIAKMACDWESAADKFKEIGARVIQMRLSLIFNKNAGFLKYNLLSMQYGIGIVIGKGNNTINWIHIDDVVNFILESIKNKNYTGPYNLASNETISQRELIKFIKKKLFPYSVIIKVPIFLVKLLLGKRIQIIDTNISISVNKLKEQGFLWKYNNLDKMLERNKSI